MKWLCRRQNCWLGNLALGIKLAKHLYTLLWQSPWLCHFRNRKEESVIGMEKPGRRIEGDVVRDEEEMADARPKFVLVRSQGTTCSICSWQHVTQGAVNSIIKWNLPSRAGNPLLSRGEQLKRQDWGKKRCYKLSKNCQRWLMNHWQSIDVSLMK